MNFRIIFLIVAAVLAVVLTILSLRFSSFRNWLVFAVSEAERTLGGGTGKLKLRYAYNIAIKYFPTLTKMIPFSLFSVMVDNALETMRAMIDTNKAISDVIHNKDKTDNKDKE